MAAPIVERLRVLVEKDIGKSTSQQGDFPTSFYTEETKEWTFHSNYLNKQTPEFFKQLIPKHLALTTDLAVLRTRLADDLAKIDKATPSEKDEIIRKLQAALAVAAVLEKLYGEYLIVPREEARLLAEQREYRDWLEKYWGYHFSALDLSRKVKVNQGLASTQTTRVKHGELNPARLAILRVRRLLLLMTLVLTQFDQFGHLFNALDAFVAPVIPYVAWIFFMPRLVMNLALTCKHVINHPWMSKKEQLLGWQTRLLGQVERRWQEISNDIAWFINGIVTCFILTGRLMPFAVYLAIGMQGYDLILACFRTYLEVTRSQALEQEYLAMCKNASPDQQQEIQNHLKDLRARMTMERKALYLGLLNFSVLFMGMCMALPYFFLISPVIPIVGASLAVLVTIVNYVGTQQLVEERRQKYDRVKMPSLPKPKQVTNNQKDKFKLFGEQVDVNKAKLEAESGSDDAQEAQDSKKSRYPQGGYVPSTAKAEEGRRFSGSVSDLQALQSTLKENGMSVPGGATFT